MFKASTAVALITGSVTSTVQAADDAKLKATKTDLAFTNFIP
ncbi:sulfatase [Aeromonas sp. HMWF014]|jgi:hypothetical protein|nr:sulfatase [Aeromonas sp. HMWF014]